MPRLNIDLAMRIAEFQDAIRKVEGQLTKVGKSVSRSFGDVRNVIRTTVAALGVRALAGQFDALTESLDRIAKNAEAFGLTTDELQKLTFAAEQSGVRFEDLTRSLGLLAKNMADFQKGTGEAKDAFQALKINVESAPGVLKDTDQVLGEIADRFASFGPSANKTALAIKLFGESGARLVPFLNKGSAGIDELKKKAEELGVVIHDDVIKAAVEFRDNMAQLERSMDTIKINALGPLIKDLAELTGRFIAAGNEAFTFGEKLKFAILGTSVGRVVELRLEVEKLQRKLSEGTGLGDALRTGINRATGGVGTLIFGESVRDQLTNAKAELSEAEKFLKAQDEFFERRRQAQTGTGTAPALANQAAADAARKAALALQKARGDAELQEQERIADQRLKSLDRFYAQGLIKEEDYWEARHTVQRIALDASLKAVDEEIALRQKAVGAAPRGSADFFNATRELEAALRKRNDLEREFAEQTTENYFKAQEGARAYEDEVTRVTAEILRLRGATEAAVVLTTELEQKDSRRRAAQRGDTGTEALLNQIRDARAAEAAFNEERQRGQDILRNLAIQEERIQNSRRVGAKTELESLRDTENARRAAAEQLRSVDANLTEIANRSGLPELTRQARDFSVELETLASNTDLLAEKFDSIVQTSLGDLFDDLIDGSKSAKEAFEDFGKSVTKQINDIIAQELGQKLYQSLLGPGSAIGGQGGAGGFLSSLFTTGSGFGASGGGQISSSLGAELVAQGVFGFQHGGEFRVGGFGGPDSQLVAFRASPDERVKVMTPGQSGDSMTNHITINVPESTNRATASQIAAEVGFAVSRATRRNG